MMALYFCLVIYLICMAFILDVLSLLFNKGLKETAFLTSTEKHFYTFTLLCIMCLSFVDLRILKNK